MLKLFTIILWDKQVGQFGGFTGKGVKTIVPGKAIAKIACRLVPDQDPYDILKVRISVWKEHACLIT